MNDISNKIDSIIMHKSISAEKDIPISLYLDLAENIVRQIVDWQTVDGMIGDPYNEPGVESVTATARYCGALGHLLKANRALDLYASAVSAMDWCCKQLTIAQQTRKKWSCSVFNLKDMLVLYETLQKEKPPCFSSWTSQLQSVSPEDLYYGERNWRFYAAASEVMRIKLGLSDRLDYVDNVIESQMEYWTQNGMYRDPDDPVTYDLTVRQSLAFMLENGYHGKHEEWMRNILRQGALTTLLFMSPAGVAPYGGRSNQYHISEGMVAYLGEHQAKAELRNGNTALAQALHSMALAGAESVKYYLFQNPYLCIKNEFGDQSRWGQDGFDNIQNAHSGYGLLAANLFAGAYHLVDYKIKTDSTPCAISGYVLYLKNAFGRIWATVGDYHIEINIIGAAGHDAIGLGRIHRRGVPIEAAINMSIVKNPEYAIPVKCAERDVALGVGYFDGEDYQYLASLKKDSYDCTMEIHQENIDLVDFTITYKNRITQAPIAMERYVIKSDGIEVTARAHNATKLRLQVPSIETNGKYFSNATLHSNSIETEYHGHIFSVALDTEISSSYWEPWTAPNRNGIYRIAVFEIPDSQVTYKIKLK